VTSLADRQRQRPPCTAARYDLAAAMGSAITAGRLMTPTPGWKPPPRG